MVSTSTSTAVPEPRRETRFRRFQRWWVGIVVVLLVALTLGIATAGWQAQQFGNSGAGGAIIDVTVRGDNTATFEQIRPGGADQAVFEFVNSSTTGLRGGGVQPAATITQTSGTGATSAFAEATTIEIAACVSGWAWNDGDPSCTTYETVTTLSLAELAANQTASSPLYVPLADQQTRGLRYQVNYSADMPSSVQGAEFEIVWIFDVAPRSGEAR